MNEICNVCRGKLKRQVITYTQLYEGHPVVIENVPAWVCQQCDEVYYDPDTVEKIQQIIWSHSPPLRIVETPVYDLNTA